MGNITIQKKVFGKNSYNKVINTSFEQLIQPLSIEAPETLESKIQNFFKTYNELFYNIPKEGENNSHVYLINNSTEYTGYSSESDTINALLEEITQLKQDLLKAESIIASSK